MSEPGSTPAGFQWVDTRWERRVWYGSRLVFVQLPKFVTTKTNKQTVPKFVLYCALDSRLNLLLFHIFLRVLLMKLGGIHLKFKGFCHETSKFQVKSTWISVISGWPQFSRRLKSYVE